MPPPPRRVRLISGGCGFWFGRLFILPHTVVGIGVAGYLLFLILWALFARDIPGVVTDTQITHSAKGGDSCHLKYRYQVNMATKTGSAIVDETVYQRYQLHELTAVTVRYFSLGPLEYDGLREGGGPWSLVGFLLLWLTFWNGILSVFWYVLWIQPLRRPQLYRHGAVTTGTVVSKRFTSGKSNRYYVTYTFLPPATNQPLTAETLVAGSAAWEQATEGQRITVLYWPGKPKRSTIYEYGGYACVEAGGF